MAAEVKFTLSAAEHQLLRALLRFEAGKIDEPQFRAVLAMLGYSQNIAHIAEKLAEAIE